MPSAPERTNVLTPRERLLWAQQVFIALLVMWLALDAFARPVLGLLTALAGAALAAWLAVNRPVPLAPLQVPVFALFFLRESLRGGSDVAWRALHPALPIGPCFATFRLDLPRGQPRTLMVSVLSLMPGTLSAELLDGGRTLVVHALTPAALDSVDALHRRIRRLFGLTATSPTLLGDEP